MTHLNSFGRRLAELSDPSISHMSIRATTTISTQDRLHRIPPRSRLGTALATAARPRIALLGLVLLLAQAATARAAETLTYADLVRRMIEPERLAVLPVPGETTAQWSSYDRASRYDEETDRYLNWAANNDGFSPQYIRKEGDNEVLAEMEGPGVIWRIWSANPKEGHVKIYLDGNPEPVVNLPFNGYFDRSNAPFDHPALVYTTAAQGHNSYVPIPYQKSCKIVAEPGWGQYYQFTYSTFPEGTQVPTFTREMSQEATAALQQVGDFLEDELGTNPAGSREGEETTSQTVTVPAGETVTVAELSGERAITSLRVKADFSNRAEEIAALRELVLQIRWDGEEQPSVWSPLGDFFGTAMGVNEYRSLMAGMTEEGFYAHWYMPFAEGATIELSNDGETDRTLEFEIVHAPLTRPVEELGRFHAKWHRDVESPALLARADRWPDWTVLETTGRGRFCGMMLHVWNPTAGHNWQFGRDGGWWWGEGDEKFFVDGETFPSTFGTGTEDYFGYAWCDPSLFAQAFHGQTLTQNNKGHQVVHRWQVADSIPFQESFEGYLEKYYPDQWPTKYAVVAYWYLAPDGEDPYAAHPVEQRVGYYDLTDATEGENLEIVCVTGGTAKPQQIMKNIASGTSIWSGGRQLWWQGGEVGDELTVAVPVARKATYEVRVGMTQAPDYGIGEITFARATPLAPIDCHAAELRPVEVYFGTHELEPGEHPLTLKLTGANENATGRMLGIDYVKLVPVKSDH